MTTAFVQRISPARFTAEQSRAVVELAAGDSIFAGLGGIELKSIRSRLPGPPTRLPTTIGRA